jgi:hypothetical protein
MQFPQVNNYLAVLVSGVVLFILGGLWYSPLLFAKKWVALMGFSEAEIKAAQTDKQKMAIGYVAVFLCALVTSLGMAVLTHHFPPHTVLHGLMLGFGCWLCFAGATSFGTALFSMKPLQLWLINSGYNLVSFLIAGVILAVWQ